MRILIPILLAMLALAPATAEQQPAAAAGSVCGAFGAPHVRTTLYFGLSRKTGKVTSAQWQAFLRDEVTKRFPEGLTVWEAAGQWRGADGGIVRENSRVLLLVHDETPAIRSSIQEIIATYKKNFEQESVLWETAPVCAAF
jgi:hypothetical protein